MTRSGPAGVALLAAVSELRQRIEAFERSGDPGPLHADAATAAAAEIVAAGRAGEDDAVEALAVAGDLYWRRHLTVFDAGNHHLDAAGVLFGPMLAHDRRRVPEALWARAQLSTMLAEFSLLRMTPATMCRHLLSSMDSSEALGFVVDCLPMTLVMLPPGTVRDVFAAWQVVARQRNGDATAVRDLDLDLCRRLATAVELAGLPGTAWVLSQLGELVKARYRQTQDLDEIDHAVALGVRAVRLSAEDDSFRAGAQCNLGTSYLLRMTQRLNRGADPDPQDLIDALDHCREALSIGGPGSLIHASSYASAVCLYVDVTNDPTLLAEADHALGSALAKEPAGSDAAVAWYHRGEIASRRYRLESEPSHRRDALDWYARARSEAVADDPVRTAADTARAALSGAGT
jgi:hypothetical protein